MAISITTRSRKRVFLVLWFNISSGNVVKLPSVNYFQYIQGGDIQDGEIQDGCIQNCIILMYCVQSPLCPRSYIRPLYWKATELILESPLGSHFERHSHSRLVDNASDVWTPFTWWRFTPSPNSTATRIHHPWKYTTRQRLKTFSTINTKTSRMKGRNVVLNAYWNLFSQVILVAESRIVNMKDVLSRPLGPLPGALAHAEDG